jgi:hypothetical protein
VYLLFLFALKPISVTGRTSEVPTNVNRLNKETTFEVMVPVLASPVALPPALNQ